MMPNAVHGRRNCGVVRLVSGFRAHVTQGFGIECTSNGFGGFGATSDFSALVLLLVESLVSSYSLTFTARLSTIILDIEKNGYRSRVSFYCNIHIDTIGAQRRCRCHLYQLGALFATSFPGPANILHCPIPVSGLPFRFTERKSIVIIVEPPSHTPPPQHEKVSSPNHVASHAESEPYELL